MTYLAQWDVNNRCNLNCKHCRVWKKNDVTELSLKEAKGLIAQLHYLGVKQLILSGGEPFLRKDIFDLIEYSKKFKKLVITTNGTLLNEEHLDIIKRNKINLIFSIDGATSDEHNHFR